MSRNSRNIWALLAMASISGQAGHSERAAAAEPPRLADCPELRDLSARWSDATEAFGLPGFAVVVVREDQVLMVEVGGFADAERTQPITADTMFYIASCTKPYVAMAAALLAESGKLSLDDPVRKLLPRFQTADAGLTESITVRDLLCHKPGLNSSGVVFNDAFSGEITEDRYYRLLSQAKPTGETEYSNVHFTLAGRVIEAAAGKSWKDQLTEGVFKPLGMTRTTASASRMYGDKNSAQPLTWLDGRWTASPMRKSDRTMHAAGGLGSTANDVGRWLRLFLNGGQLDGRQVVSERLVSEMLTYASKTEPEGRIRRFDGFGLGWRLGTYRGRPYVAHQGGYAGAASHISFLPREKIGVGILVNADGPAGAFLDIASIDVFDKLLGLQEDDLLPQYKERAKRYFEQFASQSSAQGTSVKPDQPLAAYVGKYENADYGTVHIDEDAGSLKLRLGDLTTAVRFNDGSAFSLKFTNDRAYEGRFIREGGASLAAVEIEVSEGGLTRFSRASK